MQFAISNVPYAICNKLYVLRSMLYVAVFSVRVVMLILDDEGGLGGCYRVHKPATHQTDIVDGCSGFLLIDTTGSDMVDARESLWLGGNMPEGRMKHHKSFMACDENGNLHGKCNSPWCALGNGSDDLWPAQDWLRYRTARVSWWFKSLQSTWMESILFSSIRLRIRT